MKQIKELFEDGFRRGFERIWEDNLEPALNNLEQGQEEIKLKLDNVAYRFELVELQKRVEFLEKKLGIAHEKR